jgi:hypothetical protein
LARHARLGFPIGGPKVVGEGLAAAQTGGSAGVRTGSKQGSALGVV